MNSHADNFSFRSYNKTISKSEIIRGFNAYRNVIKSSKVKVNGNIKALYKFSNSKKTESISIPGVKTNLQAGFLISKKMFSKAVTRNKIKRQLKESYREIKGKFTERYKPAFSVTIIFSLSGKGNEEVKINGKLNFKQLLSDMTILLDKIFKEAIQYS